MFIKKQVGLVALALGLVAMSGVVAASSNLTVSANLQQACSVTAGTIGFGNITALNSTSGSEFHTLNMMVACTNGSAPKIYTDTVRVMTKASSTETLAFTLSQSSGGADISQDSATPDNYAGTVDGSSALAPLFARITSGALAGLPAGLYTGVVAVTVGY